MTDIAAAAAYFLGEVDTEIADHAAYLVDTNSGVWVEDPQVAGVYALRATWPGQPVMAIVYTNQPHWDFEISNALEEDIAAMKPCENHVETPGVNCPTCDF